MMKSTEDEILKIKAGPELDVLVAELVMGWEDINHCGGSFTGCSPDEIDGRDIVPEYSTSIGEAWGIVEKLTELGWRVDIDCKPPLSSNVRVLLSWNHRDSDPPCDVGYAPIAAAPHAICRAALLTKIF